MAFPPFVLLSSCPVVIHASPWTIYQTAVPSTIQHSYLKSTQSRFLLSLNPAHSSFPPLLLLFAFLSLNHILFLPHPAPCSPIVFCHFYFFVLSSFHSSPLSQPYLVLFFSFFFFYPISVHYLLVCHSLYSPLVMHDFPLKSLSDVERCRMLGINEKLEFGVKPWHCPDSLSLFSSLSGSGERIQLPNRK